ncbi:VOC family protein [Lysobacter sp. cf310]|uniref:VOC family protein n=1 Tax=Lysobacter sp. cf310 TaxID=1761790 RepID=UPI0008EBED1A|nr:VOC family protein [Lysobacter sp. cf310]SFL14897.1 Catechol 2,3-dioxygenase [Lysobacter sp. cf310]
MSEDPARDGSAPLLDHLILRVADPQASLRFYREVFGFESEHVAACAFRINAHCIVDLLRHSAPERQHLAFAFDRHGFDAVLARLRARELAYGGAPFARDSQADALAPGARGWARSLYFYDPDGHNLELRCYGETASTTETQT